MYMYGPRLNPPPTPPRVTRSSFPALTYQPQSQRLQKEDSPASADQPNLVEWRRAYLPIAERKLPTFNVQGPFSGLVKDLQTSTTKRSKPQLAYVRY